MSPMTENEPAPRAPPSPDEVLAHWQARHANVWAGTHNADCWRYHDVCAMARIHGHLSSEVETLRAERAEARSEANDWYRLWFACDGTDEPEPPYEEVE